jgi:hypothetical protein
MASPSLPITSDYCPPPSTELRLRRSRHRELQEPSRQAADYSWQMPQWDCQCACEPALELYLRSFRCCTTARTRSFASKARQNGAISRCPSSELASRFRRVSFAPAGKPERGSGQRFERADGRAALSIYSRPNDTGENPATYLRHNLRTDRSELDYSRVARSFFAISSEREGVILYSRCNFARRAIHCFDLTYPQEEKRAWDAVVTRISLSLRPLER